MSGKMRENPEDRYNRNLKMWKLASFAAGAAEFIFSLISFITSASGEADILCMLIAVILFIAGPVVIALTEPDGSDADISGLQSPRRGQTALKCFVIFLLLAVIAWAAGMFSYGMKRAGY